MSNEILAANKELENPMNPDQPKPTTSETPQGNDDWIEIAGATKPIRVKDIIDKMEDDYRERHGLPDPEE